MATHQPRNLPEWQLYDVLQKVNLLQYYDNFISEGECDLLKLSNAKDTFREVTEKVGMVKKLHVRIFRNSLNEWLDDPGKHYHVPGYIMKGCDIKHERKTQNANLPIPKRRSTIIGMTNNESQNTPAGTSPVLTSRQERSNSTVGNLESQNISTGRSTVSQYGRRASRNRTLESQNNTASTGRVSAASSGSIASTLGFLESQNTPAGTSPILTSNLEGIDGTNGNLESQNISAGTSTVSRFGRIASSYRTLEQENYASTQPRTTGRTTETLQDHFNEGFRPGDSQIIRTHPVTPTLLGTEHQETQSLAQSSLLTASPQDIMDITRELHGYDTNTNVFNDFLPEVEQFGDVGQNPSAETLKDLLNQHRNMKINNVSSGDPLQMEVRRGHVLLDAITIIRFSENDLHNPLCIQFIGEEGVDIGGLRREFWSLFLHNITNSCYVTGKPGRQTFQQNYIERKKKTFFHLGQLIALSILQDGPGLPIFSDFVTDYIINGKTNVLNLDDLPDGLKDKLEMMQNSATDSEAREMYSSVLDIAADVGFIVPLTSFTRCHVQQLKAAFIESTISSCKDELNQFIEGLDTHGVLSLLRQTENMASARCLFSGRVKPLTVKQLRGLIKLRFTEGNEKRAEEATALGFITFLQATKGTATIINRINLKPKDVLMWLTGSTIVPAIGFHKPIDVHFSRTKTFVNTCALVLTLKTQPDLSSADAVAYYTELIINSQTFTRG